MIFITFIYFFLIFKSFSEYKSAFKENESLDISVKSFCTDSIVKYALNKFIHGLVIFKWEKSSQFKLIKLKCRFFYRNEQILVVDLTMEISNIFRKVNWISVKVLSEKYTDWYQ